MRLIGAVLEPEPAVAGGAGGLLDERQHLTRDAAGAG